MKIILISTAFSLAACTPLMLPGADAPVNPNHLSFGPSFGLNYKAEFKDNSTYFNAVNPGQPISGVSHIYDDGYVGVDISGNLDGLTTYWGYQNASQDVGGGIEYHARQPVEDSSSEDFPQYGFEIIYQRILGDFSKDNSGLWGLEVGFGYTNIKLDNHLGSVSVMIDTFPIGVVPPSPGYNGSFDGPGALLGDTPVRTYGNTAIMSNQKLDGDLFSIRMGPFTEWKLTSHLNVAASVGLVVAPTRLNFYYDEIGSMIGGHSIDGHASKSRVLYGPYVSVNLRYDYNESWSVFAGAQYQSLNDMNLSAGSRVARFDTGNTVNLTAGVMLRF